MYNAECNSNPSSTSNSVTQEATVREPFALEAAVPEVSVIMPSYNTARYIRKALESVLSQTVTNLEVIVVDDASTDDSVAIAQQVADPRVTIIPLAQNGGAAVARNHALNVAQGQWIAILDSDDWYAPDRLETLLRLAKDHEADVIADDLYYVSDEKDVPWTTHLRRSGESILEPTLISPERYVSSDIPGQPGLHLGFSKPLMSRTFLERHSIRYDDEIRLGQDFFIYLKCVAHGARFLLYPKAYYFYRVRPDSLVSKSQLERLNQACEGMAHLLNEEYVRRSPSLVDALSYKLRISQRLRAYYYVVEPLKQKRLVSAIGAMLRHPYFFVHLLRQMPDILWTRIRYYLLGNTSAFDPRQNGMPPRSDGWQAPEGPML